MKLSVLVNSLIKTGALTILGDFAMKSINKKDYGSLIKFTGISSAAVDVVKYLDYLNENPPLIVKGIRNIGKFIDKIKGIL